MFHTVLFWYMVLWVPVGGNDGLEKASVVFLYLFFPPYFSFCADHIRCIIILLHSLLCYLKVNSTLRSM